MSKNDDMIKLVRLFEGNQFAGEPEQKPGDQVRGTDKAVSKGQQHPFHNRLVGEEINLEDKLSKRYQDMKDVQAREKEQKKKEESDKQDVSEVSDTTLKNYKRTSAGDAINRQNIANRSGAKDPKIAKRNAGQERAEKKLQGVAEGVAEAVPMSDAVKVLRHYGADHFKTTSNELHFYKNGRAFSVDLIWNDDATRSVSLSQLNSVSRSLKGQGVEEGMLGNPGEQDSPVSQAITRRILLQRTDLLSKYGPEKVMAAIDEVADFVGDVEEIGSSDVSGWIRHVEQMLGNMEEGVAEGWDDDDDFFAKADHSGKSGVAVDRSVPGRTIGRLSNRPRDTEKPEKPFRPSNTKDTGRTTGHRSSAVQPKFGYDSANPGYSRARFGEGENPADKITVDVPLMIRIMEYAREEAQDDVDLHNVAEQLVRLSAMGKTLGMNDYEGIVGVTTEQKLSELGAVPPTPPTPPQGTAAATGNAAPASGSVSPNEQTALNKIQTNPAMKQQFDKLMTQATPGAANKPMALDPAQTDALDKIKTNAGLKGQYDRLIKQANPGATP